MREVQIAPTPLDRLAAYLDADRATRLSQYAAHAAVLLAGRAIWNVNSTATGGGVAEMLQTLLSYVRGAGVDTRWLVLTRRPTSSAFTKRVHNMLHGEPGDGGPLGPAEPRPLLAVLAANLRGPGSRVGRRATSSCCTTRRPPAGGPAPGARASTWYGAATSGGTPPTS